MRSVARLFTRNLLAEGLATTLAKLSLPHRRDCVLVLHDVISSELHHDDDNKIDVVTFERLIVSLRENFIFVPLSEIKNKAAQKHFKPRLSLTFDDGYLGVLTNAQPVLEKYKIPYCIGIVEAFISGKLQPWWDRINNADGLKLELLKRRLVQLNVSDIKNRPAGASCREMCQKVDPLVLDGILNELNFEKTKVKHRPFSLEELWYKANWDLLELAPHTVTHPWLANCSRERILEEIEKSILFVQSLGMPIASNSFILPYGVPSSIPPNLDDIFSGHLAKEKLFFYSTQPNPTSEVLEARISITSQPIAMMNLRLNFLCRLTKRQLAWL